MSLEKKDEKVSMKRTAKFERLQSELDQLSDENNVKDRKLNKVRENRYCYNVNTFYSTQLFLIISLAFYLFVIFFLITNLD